jgi:hypothetical protein
MEYSINVSNERDKSELLIILRQLFYEPNTPPQNEYLIKTIIRNIRKKEKGYSTELQMLGKKHLQQLLNAPPPLHLDYSIFNTTGYYKTGREISFEIKITQHNIKERFGVLRRMVSFAALYWQDSFIESSLVADEDINEEVEIGVKNEFGHEISPFFAFELADSDKFDEITSTILNSGVEGFTYYYDEELECGTVVIFFLSDFVAPEMTVEQGLEEFKKNILTLISVNESKRIFKCRESGLRKIRLAQYGQRTAEKGYEQFLKTLQYEEESNRRSD